MPQAARTAVTLTVLSVVVIVAAVWGFQSMTSPLPGRLEAPICVETDVAQGDLVHTGDVAVSVLNAGSRSGLAGRTMTLFTEAGFVEGETGNAPDGVKVARAAILTADRSDPAIPLVRSWLGPKASDVRMRPAKVEELDMPGVLVVVGNKFDDLRNGRDAVEAQSDTTTCLAPTPDQPL